MKYGYFDIENKEFVITRPDTPSPWINYLSNGKYCAMISNTAGGYSFFIDPRDQRILRYRYNNIPVDRPGRYIYIRDTKTKNYWSPTWQPVLAHLTFYECRHGLGYTRIKGSFDELQAELTYFVPVDDTIEIWKIKLTNLSRKAKTLQLFSYAEFCLWRALSDQRDLQYIQNVAQAKFNGEHKAIMYHLHDFSSPIAMFAVNREISGYDCDRDLFIGQYRSESNPLRIEQGSCTNSQAVGGNPIAATCINLKLDPGESTELVYLLAVGYKTKNTADLIEKYKDPLHVQSELVKLQQYWENLLQKLVVSTPHSGFNSIINTWNQYQCYTTFYWSRYVSFYETGLGRGMGFRDAYQDTLGICHALPNKVRERILVLAALQFEDGHAYHLFFPMTGEGEFPEYVNPRMKFFGDDHLWMIYSVCNYLKETGDFAILNESVKFVEGSLGSLYDHLTRAIEFPKNNMGPHGFPLIGTADWNDTLQLHGPNKHGESIMVAMMYYKALIELNTIAIQIGREQDSKNLLSLAAYIKDHINVHAWDGEWYIRAYTDDGTVVGSKSNTEGQLFLNTQSWAVFSGVADESRGKKCMDMVDQRLKTKYGVKLLDPPYSQYDPSLRGITTFPPGLKENAAIFCHTNPWTEIAECILGRGERAFGIYDAIAPYTKNEIADIHFTEPYVYSQMITGIDHPKFGQAKNSWLTGTASWTFKAATDWILGVQPDFHGLIIDPCIPATWDGFSLRRTFRNAIFEISVKNPNHVSKGVSSIRIDGNVHRSMPIPVYSDGKTHKIEIIMGDKPQ